MFKISQVKKREGRYCCAYACTNEPVARKGGLCHKHYARKVREEDPVQARYNQFRCNASRRGIPVEVTLEEFRQFCIDNDYIVVKGRRGQNATIDRIRNKECYKIGNMQILTNRRNASKGDREYPF